MKLVLAARWSQKAGFTQPLRVKYAPLSTTYPKVLSTARRFWTPMMKISEAMRSRQRARMKGFLRPSWSDHFPSHDTVKMAMKGAEFMEFFKMIE